MNRLLAILILLWGTAFSQMALSAEEAKIQKEEPPTETMASYLLKELGSRERDAYARYEKALSSEDVKAIEEELQSIVDGYETLISAAPQYSPAYIAFGMLLHRVGERKASNAMLIKADELDPFHAIVKNQLGNYQAEEGNYPEAMGFYLMAIDLMPEEPLYQYQMGNLLFNFKAFFVDDKLFSSEGIDLKIQEYFRKAAMLAPSEMQYRLRYAQSFFDVAKPNWEAALMEWQQLAELPTDPGEQQLMKLYMARVRYEMGHHNAARKILKNIDNPALEKSKAELIALLNNTPGSEKK